MSPIGVATSSSISGKQVDTAKLWMLLIGVNKYQDEQLPDLHYSAVDCQGLAAALADATTQFQNQDVKIYHDFAPQPPCLKNVLTSLQVITNNAKSIDTILVYFSGHGFVEASTEQVCLCLTDTKKNDLLNTSLRMQELLQLLANSAAQNQLVWLDACHSGSMSLRGAKSEQLVNPTSQLVEVLQQRAAKSKGFYALLSCDTNQQAWEFPELKHGVFTYYLMRGLRGEAADSQGVISIDGLYKYVYHQTLQYIDKTNQQLRLINQQKRGKGNNQFFQEYTLQTPKRIVEGIGELVLGKIVKKIPLSKQQSIGLIVDGLVASTTILNISKLLGTVGGLELEYLQATKLSAEKLRQNITDNLQATADTILLYLRGCLEESEIGEWLSLGENICIKLSWLKQQLRQSLAAKQIIILDILDNPKYSGNSPSLQIWVEELQIDSHQGQCVIACTSPASEPEKFAAILFDILNKSSPTTGLSAAAAIAQLQLKLAGSGIPLYIWLSATQGIIEILPANPDLHFQQQRNGLDLGICPYLGLSAFSESDTQYFYGRDTLTQQLVNHLANSSFLALIGASGSGKSSIVQAGLIPQLRLGKQIPNSENWCLFSIRPGANPLEVLARKLGEAKTGEQGSQCVALVPKVVATGVSRGAGEDYVPSSHFLLEGMLYQGVEGFVYWLRSRPEPMIVLVVDQFEELFTLSTSEDRQKFLELILGAIQYASDRFKLIITVRADFIAACLEIPVLATALQESSVLVPPKLSLDDYRQVIINPAQQVGLKVEPELVEVLLRDLDNAVGDLPLLEFVLEQLWQNRVAGQLTLQAYQEKLGKMQGALERACQFVYENLDTEAQDCAKWIFLSLTQLGEGTEDTRRRVLKSELIVPRYSTSLVERTLKALTDAKLVVINFEEDVNTFGTSRGNKERNSPPLFSEVTVEVAHEILISHWSTLRWWLEENRNKLRLQRQIEQAAQLWQQSGEKADFLLQGVRLAAAEDIYIKYNDELSPDVQKFIEACLVEKKRQQIQEKKRLRQAQKAVVALSVLGIAACSFAGLAYWQGRSAKLREIQALNSASIANLLSNQQLEALIASVKAEKQLKQVIAAPEDLKAVTNQELQKVLATIQERNRLEGHDAEILGIKFSPDGKIIASASADKKIKLWQKNGLLLRTLTGHEDYVTDIHFTSDSNNLISASTDGTVKIWRVSDGKLTRTLNNSKLGIINLSPDNKIIASIYPDHTIKLWRLSDGSLLKTLDGHNGLVTSVSFSPDGKTIISSSQDKTIKLWTVSDGKLLRTINAHQDWINDVTFSPDGQTIASASADKTIKLWNSRDGKLIKELNQHTDSVWRVAFSPDGKTIASGSKDKTIKIWSNNGIELDTFKGHSDSVSSFSFSVDNQIIASGSLDGTIKIWQRKDTSLLRVLAGHDNGVQAVNYSPDGKTIASGSLDGTIKLWQPNNGALPKTIPGNGSEVYDVSFSPDGSTIASASADKTVKIWRIADGDLLRVLTGHTDDINQVSFSPNGKNLATASRDNTIKIWNSSNGNLIHTLKGHTSEVYTVKFSPDGQTIVSGSFDGSIYFWNSQDSRLIIKIPANSGAVFNISFSPDGKIIASSNADKTIKLWSSHNGQLLRTLTGHNSAVYSSRFSADGQMIASASEDKTVKVWHIDGRLLKTLPEHGNAVMSVSFSPDGKTLVSGSSDSTVRFWKLELDSFVINGCNWLHDYLNTNSKLDSQDKKLCDD